MKFSKETLKIFDSICKVCPSIYFVKGSKQISRSEGYGSVITVFETEEFDRDVPIFSLADFKNALRLFDDPEIELKETHFLMREGNKTLRYMYSDDIFFREQLEEGGLKEPLFDDVRVSFKLTGEQIRSIKRFVRTFKFTNMVVEGNGHKIVLTLVLDDIADSFQLEVGTTDQIFELQFALESLDLIEIDYDVSISGQRQIVKFESIDPDYKIAYYTIAMAESKGFTND